MYRAIAFAFLLSTVAACSTPPIVYDPKDLPGQPPTGSVRALRELLPSDGRRVRLVFVHGVGDHCSGYALDPSTGWLNDATARRLGIHATSKYPREHGFINVSVFMGGVKDARSGVEYSTRSYSLKAVGLTNEIQVDAIEITWSPLTQWIKSNQLGYDSPSTTPIPGSKTEGCTQAPDEGIQATKEPPDRLLLDRVIKEDVFNRNLSDAILYSGSYGATMERGVAEALCHALTSTPDDVKCSWPSRNPDTPHDKYFFVTHSLGSRVIYDVFLNLLDYSTEAKPNPFTKGEIRNAESAVSGMLANTQAFYMMANQLSLLGLANVPKDARSGSGLHPYSLPVFRLSGAGALLDSAPDLAPDPALPASAGRQVFMNVLQAIATARSRAISALGSDSPRLQIVGFNDTNDLLTWHIPPWYLNEGEKTANDRPLIDITNVFVQNTAKLLVIESPGAAHSGYFKNPDVWDVISCGASGGSVKKCQ